MQPQNLWQWVFLFIGILIIGSAVACFRSSRQNPPQLISDFNPPSLSRVMPAQKIKAPRAKKTKKTKSKSKPARIRETFSGTRIPLNSADVMELAALPRISQKSARAIVAWRDRHGPFFTFQEIEKVPGLTAAVREALKQFTVCSY